MRNSPINFFFRNTISSILVSNFHISRPNKIPKFKGVQFKSILKSQSKINFILVALTLGVLTRTKPFIMKGLKNFKTNTTSVKGILLKVSSISGIFLLDFLQNFLQDNRDSFKRLLKQPANVSGLFFQKLLEDPLVYKLQDFNPNLCNAKQVYIKMSLVFTNSNDILDIFLFNVFLHAKMSPFVIYDEQIDQSEQIDDFEQEFCKYEKIAT